MSQTTADPAMLRLPLKEKIAYVIGDLDSNILLDIGMLYLLTFYTNALGLPGTYGGIIFLIAKFFTAFTDMGTGVVLDSQRKIGPKGKFRPFVLYGSFPVALLATANFIGTPLEMTGKTVVATLLFMLYGLCHSLNWALVSDTVEYGEWRTDVRSEGTVYMDSPTFAKCPKRWLAFFQGGAYTNWLRSKRGAIDQHSRRVTPVDLHVSLYDHGPGHNYNGRFLQPQRENVLPYR